MSLAEFERLERSGYIEEIDRLVKRQLEDTWVFGRLPGTPHFKNVMAIAIRQCEQLQAKEVCTEHILLALLVEGGSVACKALATLGLKLDDVRADLVEMTARP